MVLVYFFDLHAILNVELVKVEKSEEEGREGKGEEEGKARQGKGKRVKKRGEDVKRRRGEGGKD